MATIFFPNRAMERLGFAFHGEPSVSIQSRPVFEWAHSLKRNSAVHFWSNESFEGEGKLLDNFFEGINVCDTRVGS